MATMFFETRLSVFKKLICCCICKFICSNVRICGNRSLITNRRSMMDHEDRAMAKLLRVMRYFGVAPYRSLQSTQISRPFTFYSRILFFCFGGMIIWALMLDLQRRTHELATSKSIVMYLLSSIIILSVTSVLYLGMFHSPRRMGRTFYYWKRVKEISQSIGGLPAADPAQLQVCLLLTAMQFALIILNLFDAWIFCKNYGNLLKSFLIVSTINCGYFISNQIMMHFVLVVMNISLPYRAINEQLVEVATVMQSTENRFGCTVFNVPTAKINQTINVLEKLDVGKEGIKLAHHKLRALARAYVSTCGLVQQHSDSEEKLLLFLLAYILMNVANSGYFIVAHSFFIQENDLPSVALEIFWYFLHIFRGILLAAPWHKIDDEVGRTRNLICKLMSKVRNTHDPMLAELEVFHIHLTASNPSYTALGMFTMKRPTILTMMALATTGLAVFL